MLIALEARINFAEQDYLMNPLLANSEPEIENEEPTCDPKCDSEKQRCVTKIKKSCISYNAVAEDDEQCKKTPGCKLSFKEERCYEIFGAPTCYYSREGYCFNPTKYLVRGQQCKAGKKCGEGKTMFVECVDA